MTAPRGASWTSAYLGCERTSDKGKSGMHSQPTVAPSLEEIANVPDDGVHERRCFYQTPFSAMIFDLNETNEDR